MESTATAKFNPNAPIYLQIIDDIKHRIVSGELQAGQRLDSVRDLAVAFNVNPNTMQRALAELERDGLLHSERTSGRYISEDKELIRGMREEEAKELISQFIEQMKKIGYSTTELIELLSTEIKKGA